MLIKFRKASAVKASEIINKDLYLNRRKFMSAVATLGGATLIPTFAIPSESGSSRLNNVKKTKWGKSLKLTDLEAITSHNNFYEFLPGRGGPVWKHTGEFKVQPWKIDVTGECSKPTTFDLDELLKFEQEERTYHFRCVERWAMNVPWTGFPLSKLLMRVEPSNNAKYVKFTSALEHTQMPGVREANWYPWPYEEALRIDEAMNPLAIIATGVYGKPLLKQHGAPARIVVPWKYGYKNPKSIVKIELLSQQPKTFWQIQLHEYGFLSNVNPFIPHPRWSQAKSHWLDNDEPFSTPIFNGYESYVAELYPDEPRQLQLPLRPGQMAR